VKQKALLNTAIVNRSLTRVYAKDNVWYIFGAATQVELELQAHPQVVEAILQEPHRPHGILAVPPKSFLQALSPRSDPRLMAALAELSAKASA